MAFSPFLTQKMTCLFDLSNINKTKPLQDKEWFFYYIVPVRVMIPFTLIRIQLHSESNYMMYDEHHHKKKHVQIDAHECFFKT